MRFSVFVFMSIWQIAMLSAQSLYCNSYSTMVDLETMTSTVAFDQYNRVPDGVVAYVKDYETGRVISESLNQTFVGIPEGNFIYEINNSQCRFSVKIQRILEAIDDEYTKSLTFKEKVGQQTYTLDIMQNDLITSSGAKSIPIESDDYVLVLVDNQDPNCYVENNQLVFKPEQLGDYTYSYYYYHRLFPDEQKSNVATVVIHVMQQDMPDVSLPEAELFGVSEFDKAVVPPPYDDVPLEIPEYFTPNGDGTNDEWRIPALANVKGFELRIFDRFGKQVAEIINEEVAWDGSYRGKPLPSADYWYHLYLRDNDRCLKGHFLLVR